MTIMMISPVDQLVYPSPSKVVALLVDLGEPKELRISKIQKSCGLKYLHFCWKKR